RLRECERLPIIEAVEIALQICQALAAAHETGIVHRDIKPENVMIRRDGYVKVLDFGLAKVSENDPVSPDSSQSSLTDPGTVMGTASYMSPEQARGQRVDARTDIFSLGIVLYEMVAGRLPFEGANMFEVIAAIMEREATSLAVHNPDAPAELQRIVSRMLHKNRDERYQTVKEMLIDLESLRDEWKLTARLKGRQSSDTATQTNSSRQRTAEEVKETDTTSSAKIILSEIKRHKLGVMAMLTALGVFVAGGAFGLYKLLGNKSASVKPSSVAVKVTPLTAFAGLESKPSFSPDGNQIAFSWVGEAGDNTDIYIKEIGGEGMRRLTTHRGIDSDAVWSPDGRSIAFFRITEEGGAIYVMPSLGGVERKLTDISPLRATQILQADMSWSPDGKLLAFADRSSFDEPMGIVLLSLDTGERRKLTTPIPNTTGDYTPSFSPDGKTILFNRSVASEAQRDGYVVPVSG
ncbi:MAG: protein kinase domain-containing protein, partial [Blastocatellia bacterium]